MMNIVQDDFDQCNVNYIAYTTVYSIFKGNKLHIIDENGISLLYLIFKKRTLWKMCRKTIKLLSLVALSGFYSSLYADIGDKSLNKYFVEDSQYCCESNSELSDYLYLVANKPWEMDGADATSTYGTDSAYMLSVLDTFFNEYYLSQQSFAIDENLSIKQQEKQLEFLASALGVVESKGATEEAIASLTKLLDVIIPGEENLNFVERLQLYIQLNNNNDRAELRNIMFHELEKPSVISFNEQ